MKLARAIYRVLLCAWPRHFRQRFGKEMLQSFESRYRDAAKRGPLAVIRFAIAILADLLTTALPERFTSQPEPAAEIVPAGAPTFGMIHSEPPRPSAVMAGTLITLITLAAIVTAIDRSAIQHWRAVFLRTETRPGVFNASLGTAAPAILPAGRHREITADLLAQFDHADLLALGELHNSPEDSALRINLIDNPDFPNRVHNIVIEFGNASHQATLDRYIAGDNVPIAEVRKIWRDITTPGGADAPVYGEFLAEVRKINQALPADRELRVLAGNPPIDWNKINGPDDWRRIASTSDAFAADLIEREVLQKNEKALLIYGEGHVWRNAYGGPIPARSTLIPLLDARHPASTRAIIPIPLGEYRDTGEIESLLHTADRPALLEFKGPEGFDLDPNEFTSAPLHLPFDLFPAGFRVPQIADGFVYYGRTHVERIPPPSPDKAWVTELARREALIGAR